VWWTFTDVSEVFAASVIRAVMEAASTSETSVNFYQTTRRNNQEDSHLPTRRRDNLKSHFFKVFHIRHCTENNQVSPACDTTNGHWPASGDLTHLIATRGNTQKFYVGL
jgi:hypothetical protein